MKTIWMAETSGPSTEYVGDGIQKSRILPAKFARIIAHSSDDIMNRENLPLYLALGPARSHPWPKPSRISGRPRGGNQ